MPGWVDKCSPSLCLQLAQCSAPHKEVFSQQGGSREGARSLRHCLHLLHLQGEVSPVSAALSSGGAQRRLTAVGLGFHFYNRLHAHPLLHSGKMGAPRWPEHRTVTITEHTDKGAITLRTQHSLGKPITPKHRSLFTWGSPTRSQQQARSGGGHSGAGGTPRGPGEAGVCSTVPGCDLGSSPPWALGTVPTSSICLTGPGWWLVIKLHITLF